MHSPDSPKAPRATIAHILTDIRRLPEWNPAIFSVATDDSAAVLLKENSVRAKLPGSPTMTYEKVSSDQISWRLEGFQAHETWSWKLVPATEHSTKVTHTIAHNGAIFRVLAGSFPSVPGLRLDRLQCRVEFGD